MPTNKIVTRGFGPVRDGIPGRAGPVTRGYGGRFVEQIVEIVTRRFTPGTRNIRRKIDDEIVITATLIEVNDQPPPVQIKGSVRAHVSRQFVRSLIEHISTRVRQLLVKVSLLRDRGGE